MTLLYLVLYCFYCLFSIGLLQISCLHSWLLDSLLTVSLVGVPLGAVGKVLHIIFYYFKPGCYSGHNGYYFIHSISFLITVAYYFLAFSFVLTCVGLVPFFGTTW